MITTREINVNLSKGKLKLRQVTTKNIDAGIRVEPPKEPIKRRGVSTTNIADVADIAEKKRRDDIMAERKLAIKDEKKIVTAEKKIKPVIKVVKPAFQKNMAIYQNEQNELIAKEKKLAMKERMAKVRAAKAKKK